MVNQASLRFLRYCIQYSSVAWLYYDYLLTFSREVKYIWRQRFSYVTACYIACRYALIANVLYTLALSNRVPNVKHAVTACSSLGVVGRFAVLTIWTVRTWAVWERNVWVLVLLVPLLLLCVLCDIIGATPAGTPNVDSAMAVGTVVHESLSMGLTVWRCWVTIRNPELERLPKNGLYYHILNQGLLYFGVVTALTLSATVLHYRAPITREGDFFQHLLSAFVLPVSGFFTARFILHMRELGDGQLSGGIKKSDAVLASMTVSGLSFGRHRGRGSSSEGDLDHYLDNRSEEAAGTYSEQSGTVGRSSGA